MVSTVRQKIRNIRLASLTCLAESIIANVPAPHANRDTNAPKMDFIANKSTAVRSTQIAKTVRNV